MPRDIKLFAAIALPPDIVSRLTKLQRGVAGARWVAPEKLHITVGYFGTVDDEQAEMLDVELARPVSGSFEVTLRGAGHFGNKEPHAIWMGVEDNPALTLLHKHCKKAARRAGITMEKRHYRPHVTMAYLKPEPRIDRVVNFEFRLAEFTLGPFLVDQFSLFSSHENKRGANTYVQQATYPLLGSDISA